MAIPFGSLVMGAASGVAQRIAQKYISTPMETAQIANMVANFELQRERLKDEERRFMIQLQENRENKLRDLQNQKDLHEHLKQIDKWPLQVMGSSILKDSNTRHGRALNVILKMSTTEPGPPASPAVKARNAALAEAAHIAVSCCERLFGNGARFFNELHLPTTMTGHALSATLFTLLDTAPVALVEARVASSSKICVAVSVWGWELDQQTYISETARIDLDFAPLWAGIRATDSAAISAAGERTVHLLANGFSALMAQLGDSFHVLRQPHTPPSLKLPSVMLQQNADLSEEHWIEIVNNYVSLNDHMGLLAPPLAAESTAKMALSAFEAGQKRFADSLLDKSLIYLKTGSGSSTAVDDVQFIEQVMRPSQGKRLILVQEALGLIRGVRPPADIPDQGGSPRVGLADMSRRGISRLSRF